MHLDWGIPTKLPFFTNTGHTMTLYFPRFGKKTLSHSLDFLTPLRWKLDFVLIRVQVLVLVDHPNKWTAKVSSQPEKQSATLVYPSSYVCFVCLFLCFCLCCWALFVGMSVIIHPQSPSMWLKEKHKSYNQKHASKFNLEFGPKE